MHCQAHAISDQVCAENAHLGEQSRELVAADPGHHIPSAHKEPERVAHRAQQRITRGMAMGVIGGLQAVKVQGEDGERLARYGAQRPIEFAPIVQTGERIRRGQGGKFHGCFMEGVIGANPLEEATNVMAGHRDGVEHAADGTLYGLAKNGEHTDHPVVGPDREGHCAAEVSLGCLTSSGRPSHLRPWGLPSNRVRSSVPG